MKQTAYHFIKRVNVYSLFFFFLLLDFNAYAQSDPSTTSADFGAPTLFTPQLTITPSAIVNSDLVHESLFNGTLNISIPIHELNSNMLKVPVSLNYNTGGIKVQEQASRVGLGWQLSAGGMIKREIRGISDDWLNYIPRSEEPFTPAVPDHYAGLFAQSPGTVVSSIDLFENHNSPTAQYYAMKFGTEKSFDGEPDIYHFNFNGYSGKIVFDVNKVPHIISKENIKIAVSYYDQNEGNTFISQWTLTTGDGVQYIFGTPELINFRCAAVFDYATPEYYYTDAKQRISGWCLDKIVSPSTHNTIDFTYAPTDTVFFQSHYQVSYNAYAATSAVNGSISYETPYPGYTASTKADGYTYYYVLGQRISKISANNSTVIFNYSPEYDSQHQPVRKDLPRDTYLTSIQVQTPNGNCSTQVVKTFTMAYKYLQDGGCVLSTCKRLGLTSVTESANGLSKPPYLLSYNESTNLPDNEATQFADYWGYFNDADTDDGTLYPSGTFSDPAYNHVLTLQGTNKASDANGNADLLGLGYSMQANVLTSITNPGGGINSFTYEANSIYDNASATNKIVGGLRIKQTKTYDGINHTKDIIKNYQYLIDGSTTQSSGSIGAMPVYQYAKRIAYPGVANYEYVVNFADPLVEIQTTNGSHIAYSCVTISQANKGKSVYKYTDFKDHPDVDTNLPVYSFEVDGADMTTSLVQGPKTCYLPATSMEMERGLLLSKSDYDNNGNIQKRVTNTYNFNDPNQVVITGVRANNKNLYPGYIIFTEDCNLGYFLCQQITNEYIADQGTTFDRDFSLVAKLSTTDVTTGYFGFYNTVSKWVTLTSTSEEVYDQNNVNNKVTTSTSYEYSLSNLQPNKITTTNSDSRQLVTLMIYPGDYNTENGTNTDGYFASHINELLEEKVTYEITTTGAVNILSGEGYEYDVSTGLLQFQYSLENATTIPLASFKFSNQLTGVLPALGNTPQIRLLDSRYVKRMTCDFYDAKDNLVESHEEKGVPQVTLWGQNFAYPIAKVANVPHNKVAYSSFECGAANPSPLPSPLEGNLYQFGTYYPTAAVTGQNAFYGTVVVPGLPTDTYKVSFWIKSVNNTVTFVDFNGTDIPVSAGNTWQYIERIVTLAGDFQLCTNCDNSEDESGTGIIDEFRLCPVGALMTTTVYQPLVGVAATADTRNVLTTYQYDPLNRLKLVLDQDNNIRKRYTYNYKQ